MLFLDICKSIVFNDLAVIKSIKDYHQIDNRLATSGQPTPSEFAAIAQAGYRASYSMNQIWQPTGVWQELIVQTEAHFGNDNPTANS